MDSLLSRGGHSAQVNIQLLINGLSIPVRQLGPDFIFVNSTVNYPPTAASIVLQVDESEQRWNIHLPNGITAGTDRVKIAASA